MAFQPINLGAVADDRTGDDWRSGGEKINANFTELYTLFPVTTVYINQESDFPTQDLTTITLESGIRYVVNGVISTAKQFNCQGGILVGLGLTDTVDISYTGTVPMFSVQNNRLQLSGLSIDCPNADLIDLDGNGLGDSNQRVNMFNLAVPNCQKIADVSNAGAIVLDICRFENVQSTRGFEFSGVGGVVFSFNRLFIGGLASGAVGIDFGNVTTNEIEIDNYIVSGNSGAIAISGLANSGNINAGGRGSVNGGNFSALTTPLQNITVFDTRWTFFENAGLPDSRDAADAFITASETVTINTAGVFEEIDGGNWTFTIQDRFTTDTAGVVTYNGEETIPVRLEGVATVAKVGGGTDQLEARVAVNWTAADPGIVRSGAITENSTPTTVPVQALVELAPGDNVRMIVANNTTTANITVSRANLMITGA